MQERSERQVFDQEVRELINDGEQGNVHALFQLGVKFDEAPIFARDRYKALRYYSQAAEEGHPQAECNLALKYYRGESVTQDYGKAFELFSRSAAKHNAQAQCNLGVMYYKSQGVSQNKEKAVTLLELAARQGNANAQFNLALLYSNGPEANLRCALSYIEQAAAQGHRRALDNLARIQRAACIYSIELIFEEFIKKTETHGYCTQQTKIILGTLCLQLLTHYDTLKQSNTGDFLRALNRFKTAVNQEVKPVLPLLDDALDWRITLKNLLNALLRIGVRHQSELFPDTPSPARVDVEQLHSRITADYSLRKDAIGSNFEAR